LHERVVFPGPPFCECSTIMSNLEEANSVNLAKSIFVIQSPDDCVKLRGFYSLLLKIRNSVRI